jgi:conjugal transfer pilin signal peptidase TrbI
MMRSVLAKTFSARNPLLWCMVLGLVVALAIWVIRPRYEIHMNPTDSLPGTFFIVDTQRFPAAQDLVSFTWKGGSGYPPGTVLIKRLVGMPGARIAVQDRDVRVDDIPVGAAMPISPRGRPLEVIKAEVVPPNYYFVSNPSKTSFDSRYEAFGLVPRASITGTGYALF